jgi:hypothetical protein
VAAPSSWCSRLLSKVGFAAASVTFLEAANAGRRSITSPRNREAPGSFMGPGRLVGGPGRSGRVPDGVAATGTRPAGGRDRPAGGATRTANRWLTWLQDSSISSGDAGERLPSAWAATTSKAWASMARVTQRYQQCQRRTWCWSRPAADTRSTRSVSMRVRLRRMVASPGGWGGRSGGGGGPRARPGPAGGGVGPFRDRGQGTMAGLHHGDAVARTAARVWRRPRRARVGENGEGGELVTAMLTGPWVSA